MVVEMQAPVTQSGADATTGQPKSRRRESSNGQTAKKRELDRIAQKKSRERARNRMAELEEKIRRLQADDKQKQISELMGLIESLRRENERLRSMTAKIRSLTDSAGSVSKANEDWSALSGKQRSPSSDSNNEDNSSPDDLNIPQERWLGDDGSNESPEAFMMENTIMPQTTYPTDAGMDIYVPPVSEISPSYDFVPFTGLTNFDTSIASGTPGLLSLGKGVGVVPDHEKWKTSDDAFIFGINKTRKMSLAEALIIDSHAAYKAILWGCDAREEKERNHPLWLALRQVDEKVFGNWGRKAQKIAMMFVCQRMLLYKSNPTAENLSRVPSFLRPRPSQETIQHPAVIDFLIWPGLRDRLVFSYKRYTSTGEFSAAFCENLHFHWPFSDDQILLFDPMSQNLRISPLFEEYAFNLKNWTMDEGFFEKYTEMTHDIPSSADWTFEGYFDYMPT